MIVKWSKEAEISLYEVTEYIREANPEAARKVISKIRSVTNNLGEFPYMSPLHRKFPNFREAVVPGYPFVVWYRVQEKYDLVEIILIWHASQNRDI